MPTPDLILKKSVCIWAEFIVLCLKMSCMCYFSTVLQFVLSKLFQPGLLLKEMVPVAPSPILPPAFLLEQVFHIDICSPLTCVSHYSYTDVVYGTKKREHRLKSKQQGKGKFLYFSFSDDP